jgi:alpha-N-arabinofuranosidase
MMTSFQNPVVPGFHPDPSVIRVGDDYYMVTSTFEFFPGVPVLHSRDLVHWRKIGHCLTRRTQLDLDGCPSSRGIWAATIRWHQGVFYMITTIMNRGTLRKFLVTTTNPAGEWSDPVWIEQPGIDPSLLFDDDGHVYLTSNGGAQGRKGINQALLDVKTGKLLGEDRFIWAGTGGAYPEGPRLYRINGWYYLSIAEGGCQYGHMQTIARSKNPWGPFDPCPGNPILTHRDRGGHPIQGVGHMEFVTDTTGRWWAYFLGYRMTRQFFYHTGREAFLAPVSWDADCWPIVGNYGTIELEMEAELPESMPWPAAPVRDNFDGPRLGLDWNTLRNAPEGAWSLAQHPGWLTLLGNAATLSDVSAPAFVGRRQEHWDVSVATLMEFEPAIDGEEAGLAMYYQEESHYEIAVIRRAGQRRLIVRRTVGDFQAEVADQLAPPGPIELSVVADKFNYQIGHRVAGQFLFLATARTQFLSCEASFVGFTGVYFALYATGNAKPSQTPARFDWFDYRPGM